MATPAENKESSLRWFERVWNHRDRCYIYEMLGPNAVGHLEQGTFTGPDEFAKSHAMFLEGFPDLWITVEDAIAEGDHVVIRWLMEGTHRGAFRGIAATVRPIRSRGMTWHRYQDGNLTEGWDRWDFHALLQQISTCADTAAEPA
jgi:steroid delta-isomerase-like uncharacterized protein